MFSVTTDPAPSRVFPGRRPPRSGKIRPIAAATTVSRRWSTATRPPDDNNARADARAPTASQRRVRRRRGERSRHQAIARRRGCRPGGAERFRRSRRHCQTARRRDRCRRRRRCGRRAPARSPPTRRPRPRNRREDQASDEPSATDSAADHGRPGSAGRRGRDDAGPGRGADRHRCRADGGSRCYACSGNATAPLAIAAAAIAPLGAPPRSRHPAQTTIDPDAATPATADAEPPRKTDAQAAAATAAAAPRNQRPRPTQSPTRRRGIGRAVAAPVTPKAATPAKAPAAQTGTAASDGSRRRAGTADPSATATSTATPASDVAQPAGRRRQSRRPDTAPSTRRKRTAPPPRRRHRPPTQQAARHRRRPAGPTPPIHPAPACRPRARSSRSFTPAPAARPPRAIDRHGGNRCGGAAERARARDRRLGAKRQEPLRNPARSGRSRPHRCSHRRRPQRPGDLASDGRKAGNAVDAAPGRAPAAARAR